MKLTPLDLQHYTFRKTIRGFDPKQVTSLLDDIRFEWEELLRENQRQREEILQRERRLLEYQEKERALQDTLTTAQRLSEDLRQSTQKEAEIIISQAELQADKMLHQAHQRLTQIIGEIHDLKRQRVEFEGKLKSVLESHLKLLDLLNDQREKVSIEDVGLLPKAM